MAVGQLDRLVEVVEHPDADERAERLGAVERVVGCTPIDDRRVRVEPRVRVADEALRGLDAVIRPVPDEPRTVWCAWTRSSQSSKRSRKRSSIIGP